MSASAGTRPPLPQLGYRHEALLYAGLDGFVEATATFVRDGLAADEPILVMVGATKIDALRDELGRDARRVRFANMEEVGRNPARIIPAWNEFVAAQNGASMRGIGEPIWAGRRRDELAESQLHEELLNVAIPDTIPMWLLCPYDTDALEPSVLEHARAHHPYLAADGISGDSADYRGAAVTLDGPLPDAPGGDLLAFGADRLHEVRKAVHRHATSAGLDAEHAAEFVMATNEAASNSVRHGGGTGTLRIWRDGDTLVCEIRDDGHIDQLLVGREAPVKERAGGHGLWLANQFCDLVQVRSSPAGTVVRLHMRS